MIQTSLNKKVIFENGWLKPSLTEKNFQWPKISEFNKSNWFPVDENVDPLEKGLLYPVRTTSGL